MAYVLRKQQIKSLFYFPVFGEIRVEEQGKQGETNGSKIPQTVK